MKERTRWAFILDRDEFVRLSLNKILKKYGFQVEEIEDFSQLERRTKDVKGGMILADVEIEVLEGWLPFPMQRRVLHWEKKGRVPMSIRKEVKEYEEVDFSFSRIGFGDQFSLNGDWMQSQSAREASS